MPRIAEGRKAPAFTLESATGQRVSLTDFAGKDVIVYFYPKDDTPGCTKEACRLRDLWKDLRQEDHGRDPLDRLGGSRRDRAEALARVADAAKHPAQVLEAVRGRAG